MEEKEEHKATLPLTQSELRMLCCWHTLGFDTDFKARLVAQGCQEDPSMIRTDSPTGSRDSFFLVLSCAADRNIGVVVLLSQPLRTSKREE